MGLTLAAIGGASFMAVLGWSGVVAFQRNAEPVALAAMEEVGPAKQLGKRPAPRYTIEVPAVKYEEVAAGVKPATAQPKVAESRLLPSVNVSPKQPEMVTLPGVKRDSLGQVIMVNGKPWTGEVFDGRPIRAVKTQKMKTTAYSPDEKSCGKWADGITASGKSVWMNGGRLVAADKSIPFGTILTIPGYNNNKPVQVWDRGGAIKGNRLDLLYPTHEVALKWGVQDLPVVFWEFIEAD